MMPENVKFRYLEHTADVLFEAFGKNFKEALKNAAIALFNTVGKADPKEEVTIETAAQTREELVVYFLSDLLSEMDIREMVFSEVNIEVLKEAEGDFYVRAIVKGDHVLPMESVKGVTFHRLKVEQKDEGWRIQVLLDV